MLIDGNTATFHCSSPALFVDLQDHVVELDGIVTVDGPLGLDREHAIEVGAAAGDECRFICLSRRDRELFVELAFIGSIEKAVGLLRSC